MRRLRPLANSNAQHPENRGAKQFMQLVGLITATEKEAQGIDRCVRKAQPSRSPQLEANTALATLAKGQAGNRQIGGEREIAGLKKFNRPRVTGWTSRTRTSSPCPCRKRRAAKCPA